MGYHASQIPPDAALGQPLTTVAPDLEARRLLGRFQRVVDHGTVEVLAPAFHHYLIPCPPRTPSPHFTLMQQRVTIAPLREDMRVIGVIVTHEGAVGCAARSQRR